MTTADKTAGEPTTEEMPYGEAITELESLLDEIDSDDVDLDELAVKVERASRLITVCRDKIENTEMQVKAIIDDLEGGEGEGE